MIDGDTLDRRLTIERQVPDDAFDGAGSGSWVPAGKAWANVKDLLPSRSEKLGEGINFAAHPARVRMRFRTDITADMRFVLGARIMQIVSGPAEIGTRDGLEFMVEDYSAAGGGA